MDRDQLIKDINDAVSKFQNKGAILVESNGVYKLLKMGNVLIEIATDHEGPSLNFTNEKTAKYRKLIKQTMTDDIDFQYIYYLLNDLKAEDFFNQSHKLKELNLFEFQLEYVIKNWDKILEMFNDKNYRKTIKKCEKIGDKILGLTSNYTDEELSDFF